MNQNERIFFGVPSMDRRIDCECAISIFRTVQEMGGQTYFHMGVSDLPFARNTIAQRFKESDCDWLMMIDSDIIYSREDWNTLWKGSEELVCASYARKIPGKPPAEYGLGFVRAHRSVFDKIDALQNDNGTECAQRFYYDGKLYVHYFPGGVSGDSRWLGEDRAFFTLCQLAGVYHRLERNCSLQHVGNFVYGYPNQDNNCDRFWKSSPYDDTPSNNGRGSRIGYSDEDETGPDSV